MLRNLLFGILLFLAGRAYAGDSLTLVVVSDLHLMAPELLIKNGEAFEGYIENDRKILKASVPLLNQLTKEILEVAPDVILVSGDLTKDGALVSHQYLVRHCFQVLAEAGIQVLVAPGNHDINNPYAVSFDGDEKKQVKSVSPDRFADIYSNYGYGSAIARDSSSLSYVYEISPGLRLLSIDACIYGEGEELLTQPEGMIKKETELFIKKQLRDAKKKGIRVIGLMHHNLLQHWPYQKIMMSEHALKNRNKHLEYMRRLGLRIIFTGHTHAHDIVRQKGIYEVGTGSLVSYPCPFRIVEVAGNEFKITTKRIENINFALGDKSLQDYAFEFTKKGLKVHMSKHFPEKVPANINNVASDLMAEIMTLSFGGNQGLPATRKELNRQMLRVKNVAKGVEPYSFTWATIMQIMAKSLLWDQKPEDDNIVILVR